MKTREITNSTRTSKWMQCPSTKTEFPGLAYIYPLNELIIVEEKDALHDVIGTPGICYTIFNNQGQKVFLAVQDRRCKTFDVKIFNYYGNEVIQVKRLYKLCLNKALVWAPPGNFAGSVNEVKRYVNTYLVKNKDGEVVLMIKAQGLFQYVYSILSGDEEVGIVKKHWGIAAVLSVNNFGISFPVGADVTDKAVLLGACLLIGCLKY
ncbi:putative phospholipid scramblase [Operophtera brumata]|uniref:Phospholipid scramblase n=1 Tax=Operophtera brumata TaxID=104452 RepID=A0A0L7L803_OPEBR|nr:putative phospholipid scramblase [Operophtera brumata]